MNKILIGLIVVSMLLGVLITKVYDAITHKDRWLPCYHNNKLIHVNVDDMEVFHENATSKATFSNWDDLALYYEKLTLAECRSLESLKVVTRWDDRDDVNLVLMNNEVIGHLQRTSDGLSDFVGWSEEDYFEYMKPNLEKIYK